MTPGRLQDITARSTVARRENGGWEQIYRDDVPNLLAALREAQEETERLNICNISLESKNKEFEARQKAYRQYVLMRPYQRWAIQSEQENSYIELPTPESFTKLFDERDALQQQLAQAQKENQALLEVNATFSRQRAGLTEKA